MGSPAVGIPSVRAATVVPIIWRATTDGTAGRCGWKVAPVIVTLVLVIVVAVLFTVEFVRVGKFGYFVGFIGKRLSTEVFMLKGIDCVDSPLWVKETEF